MTAGCVLASGGVAASTAAADGPAPTELTVRNQARPLNVVGNPQFGWIVNSARGDDVQGAYELRVTRSSDDRQVWDSGKVASSRQSYVSYGGPNLAPGASYEWSVRTWNGADEASDWASTARFDTGIGDYDWSNAEWIRRATATGNDSTEDFSLLRKEVPSISASPVTRARVYASGMAQYEIHVNGRKVLRDASFGYPGEGQYAVADITDSVAAGQPLALSAQTHYWTCTCQGRANGPASTARLTAAATAGDTNLKVTAVNVFDVGDYVDVGPAGGSERVRVTSIGTSGASGTGITISAPLVGSFANAAAVTDLSGPTGLLAKFVVDHADGTRETFVTDGSWRVAKNTAFTNATITSRNGDAGDRLERYDATQEIAGWDAVGFDDSTWQSAISVGTHPRPVNPVRDSFSHLDPAIAELTYRTLRPVSVRTLADGTVIADFGRVMSAVPQVRFQDGVADTAVSMVMSYRLNNGRLSADVAAGATELAILRSERANDFQVGDRIAVDAPGVNFGTGDVEERTVAAIRLPADPADRTSMVVTLDRPLARAHATGAYLEGERAGTTGQDTQGSNLAWFYTQKNGDQTAQGYTYFGWRYLQITGGAAGQTIDPSDIGAVEQYSENPESHAATFDSDNATLDDVFELMQRSGRDSTQETYLDTPTREKGGFLGDGIDISWANTLALGERNATARAIREIVYSQTHKWKAAASGYCTAGQVPCSYESLLTPGRLNSVYPNGDNMRDIPDYTEAFPDWVWRYYLLTGDRKTLSDAYPAMQKVAAYIQRDVRSDGPGEGLVWNLTGGTSSYRYGIIDWPAPMRYGYTFTGNAARTIHNAEGVGAFRATQNAADALGHDDEAAQYGGWADALSTNINQKLVQPSGLYTDGLAEADGTQIANNAQHAQTYPIYFGVAPRSDWPRLADEITAQGMRQGPMTWHVLLKSLALAGRDDQIVKLMTDARADGPARTLAEGGTFMWEQWSPACATVSPCRDASQTNSESHSHGWGSWGIVDMIETLLGVEVTSPGAATVKIAPPTLTDANSPKTIRGSVWTQRGTVDVDWVRTDRGVELNTDVPVNVRAEVHIPGVSDPAYVAASGAGAPKFERIEDGAAVFSVGSGASHFAPTTPDTPVDPPVDPPVNPPVDPPVNPPVNPPANPPANPPVARDTVKPSISSLKLPRGTRIRARGTLALSLRLSERATVRVTVQRSVKGRWRSSGKAVSTRLSAGRRTLKLKLGTRVPGSYRLTLVASDAAGNKSSSKVVRFTIVRAAKPKPKAKH
ncbi:alpha-L-rhamnosidase N-terminal domain-containing protein [Conexibacter sp. CPCC 206217]|uniref:alpha-L-rhamnosidase-related protein n=1 Tax=Conexibacter sp. CPCC 206217 TaxID=3064574 RepID=UPI00271C9B5C|nr:alpha-L-rhamnosidase N-terminal domain-containing protein [Conexibacter sp. CPCC 206217]MDO8213792.1 alpha-L-rhamnosidase N-terminal domain-containing protein [Conexibacter sp. CPCC 206217]